MKIRKFTQKSYVAAVITLLVGVFVSVRMHDWNWLSRSGSLIVVIGIILTSNQILLHMHHLDQARRHHESNFNKDWARAQKSENLFLDKHHQWRNEKYGFYMLIVGTLVWGFGDLLNLL